METMETAARSDVAGVHDQANQVFSDLANQTSAFLQRGGVNIQGHREGLPHFSALSAEKKETVIQNLRFYRDVCEEQVEEGYEIKDSKSFVWRALARLGLTPPVDLFNYIRDEDIVEIYSFDNVQLFRNFRFFEFCSFTLEDLYCREWFEMYHRNEDIGPKVFEVVVKLQRGEVKGVFEPGVPMHVVTEIDSSENLVMDYGCRWIAPLTSHKQYAGFIVIEEARLIAPVAGNC